MLAVLYVQLGQGVSDDKCGMVQLVKTEKDQYFTYSKEDRPSGDPDNTKRVNPNCKEGPP